MNRFMEIPLTIFFVMAIFSFLTMGFIPNTQSYYQYTGNSNVNNIFITMINMMGGQMGIMGMGIMLIFMALSVSIMTTLDIKALTFGISMSQVGSSMIFNALFFIGLWLILSGSQAYFVVVTGSLTMLLYTGLSVMYMVGLAFHIGGIGGLQT